MLLPYFSGNKNLANKLFIFFLIPYLLFCITIGRFHDNSINSSSCSHSQQGGISHDSSGDNQAEILRHIHHHDSETCKICQWLKSPSLSMSFLSLNAHFGYIFTKFIPYSNPVLLLLSIHKFTIRPPPSFSCFSA